VTIAADDGELVLAGESGNPDIVLGDRCSATTEPLANLRVDL